MLAALLTSKTLLAPLQDWKTKVYIFLGVEYTLDPALHRPRVRNRPVCGTSSPCTPKYANHYYFYDQAHLLGGEARGLKQSILSASVFDESSLDRRPSPIPTGKVHPTPCAVLRVIAGRWRVLQRLRSCTFHRMQR